MTALLPVLPALLPAAQLRVLIADPPPVVRNGLAAVLCRYPDFCVVGEAGTGQETLNLIPELKPLVLILEIALPDMAGNAVIQSMLKDDPTVGILVFSYHKEEERIYSALKTGAKGYCFKDAAINTIVNAVRLVGSGGCFLPASIREILANRSLRTELTSKEREILVLIVQGLSNEEIATRLFIAIGTVKGHVNKLLAKLNTPSRMQAAVIALRRGLVGM